MSTKEITIPDNKSCPCGSKKKFISCCKYKNHKYSKIGTDYKGINIIVDITDQDEIAANLLGLCYSLKDTTLSKEDALSELKDIYSVVDKEIHRLKRHFSCKKRCSSCCHIFAECSYIESCLIKKYIRENFDDSMLNKIHDNYNRYIQYISTYEEVASCRSMEELNHISYEYWGKNIPCLFLNDSGTCTIYPVRPLVCRALNAITTPQSCKENVPIILKLNTVDYAVKYIDTLSASTADSDNFRINPCFNNEAEFLNYIKDDRLKFTKTQSIFHWFDDMNW